MAPTKLEQRFASVVQAAPALELTPSEKLLDNFYTQPQLADELGVTQRTLQRWEELRTGPPMIQIGRRTRLYRKSSVLKWLVAREQKSRSRR